MTESSGAPYPTTLLTIQPDVEADMAAKDINRFSVETLREAFDYEPETGVLRWRATGKLCGQSVNTSGYMAVMFRNTTLLQHRVAWVLVTGYWPNDEIDRINGIRTDNRLVNLREATRTQNQHNRIVRYDSSTGYKGVNRHKDCWRATIMIGRRRHHLGLFDTPEQAHAAYGEAAKFFHGEFARAA